MRTALRPGKPTPLRQVPDSIERPEYVWKPTVNEGHEPWVQSPEVIEKVRVASKIAANALAANPDIADKIRGGKVQAAGKIVGDVMKATRGQADPARVKELVIAACS